MAQIAIQNVDKSGSVKAYTAASSGGDTFNSSDGVFVHAKVGAAGIARVVTIAAVSDPLATVKAGSLEVPDVSVVIQPSTDRLFALPPAYISTGGIVSMTYSDEADVTLAIFRVDQ